jgi:hypothetical protein
MIDANEFFREVTLRLCSHLEIEEGLQACIRYLSRHMPADTLYLERNEFELGAMRIIARADAASCKRMDQLVPYNEQAKAAMAGWAKEYQAGRMPEVFVINRPQSEPVTRNLLEALGEPSSSAMSLPLVIENQIVGALALLILIGLVVRRLTGFDLGDRLLTKLAKIMAYAMLANVFLVLLELFTALYSGSPEHIAPWVFLYWSVDGSVAPVVLGLSCLSYVSSSHTVCQTRPYALRADARCRPKALGPLLSGPSRRRM